jgi:hypothetical protein
MFGIGKAKSPQRVFDLAIASAVQNARQNGVPEYHIAKELGDRASIIKGRLKLAQATRNAVLSAAIDPLSIKGDIVREVLRGPKKT